MARKRDAGGRPMADERMRFARYPLVLPHPQIRRMLDSRPPLMILARDLDEDLYEVHDELVIRKNAKNKRRGRSDLQDDPTMFVIEITDVIERPLVDLGGADDPAQDLLTVNRAGFKTVEDFYREWLGRRRELVAGLQVKLYAYQIQADALYLHKRPHRGYTRNPAHAVPDEPQVVDREDLDRFAADAHDRYATEHADELAKREAKSLANQLREAHARAALKGVDVTPEIQAIRQQLDQIRSKLGTAA